MEDNITNKLADVAFVCCGGFGRNISSIIDLHFENICNNDIFYTDRESSDELQLIDNIVGYKLIIVFVGLGGDYSINNLLPFLENVRAYTNNIIVIATLPFFDEDDLKLRNAIHILKRLPEFCSTTIVVNNSDYSTNEIFLNKSSLFDLNMTILSGLMSIFKLLSAPGVINLDLEDIITAFDTGKFGFIGTASSYGSNRAISAAKNLMSETSSGMFIGQAQKMVISVSSNEETTLLEIEDCIRIISDGVDENAYILYGTSISESNIFEITALFSGLNVNYDFLYNKLVNKRKFNIKKRLQTIPFPSAIQESLKLFRSETSKYQKTVFIIMNFVNTSFHIEIYNSIKKYFAEYNILAIRADEISFHDDLYYNIITYLHGCDYAVAIFDRISSNLFNPNVALEVGYALAINKDICLLKEKTLEKLPTDIVSKIYFEFDMQQIPESIISSLDRWIENTRIKNFI